MSANATADGGSAAVKVDVVVHVSLPALVAGTYVNSRYDDSISISTAFSKLTFAHHFHIFGGLILRNSQMFL